MKDIGLATVGRVSIKKDVVESDDFQAGKTGDPEAADRVVHRIWEQKKTDQVLEKVTDNTVFVSMPSTTGLNQIPARLAVELSRQTGRSFVVGDDLFNVEHQVSSKEIPRDNRVLNKREYSVVDQQATKDLLENKNVVIVDDLITSGGSIRGFKEFLNDQGIKVNHVVALMGDRRLALDNVTRDKLAQMMDEKNVGVDISNIDYITRTEAGGLLRRLNGLRGKNGLDKFTKDLQGIQRNRTITSLERDSGEGYKSQQGKDFSNEKSSERIPDYTNFSERISRASGGEQGEIVTDGIKPVPRKFEGLLHGSSDSKNSLYKSNVTHEQAKAAQTQYNYRLTLFDKVTRKGFLTKDVGLTLNPVKDEKETKMALQGEMKSMAMMSDRNLKEVGSRVSRLKSTSVEVEKTMNKTKALQSGSDFSF